MSEDRDDSKDEKADKSTEWAEQRTDFAEDRNIMAMERTYAGWIRTAFAAIGIGLGFRAVFGEFEPPWLARAIATTFILAGGMVAITAERRARKTLERLSSHDLKEVASPNYRLLSWSVAAGALLLTLGLWVLNEGDLDADPPESGSAAE